MKFDTGIGNKHRKYQTENSIWASVYNVCLFIVCSVMGFRYFR